MILRCYGPQRFCADRPDISTKIIEKAPSDHLCLLCKSRKRASVTTNHVYATFLDNSASILHSVVNKKPEILNISGINYTLICFFSPINACILRIGQTKDGQRIMKVGRVFLSSAILLSFLLNIWRKNVFFGHLTSGIVLSEQEDTSALSQEKWRSGMRGSYARTWSEVSCHSNSVVSELYGPLQCSLRTLDQEELVLIQIFHRVQSKRIALLSFECEVITCTPG